MNIGDLEVNFTGDTGNLDAAFKSVEGKIDGLNSKISTIKNGGGVLTNAAGNLLAGAIRGVVNFGKEIVGEAVEVSAYNEKIKLSLESTIAKEIHAQSAIKERVLASSKVVSVEAQIQSALAGTEKQQKQNAKVMKEAEKAAVDLQVVQARQGLNQINLAENTPGKKESTAHFIAENNLKTATINKQTYQIGKLNEKIAAGNALQEQQNAVVAKYTAAGPRIVRTYKEIITGYAVTEEQAAIQAQERVTNLINTLEQIAVKSPFNKENVINAFTTLKNFGGMAVDTSMRYVQGIADVTAVLKPDGKVMENFAGAIAKTQTFGRAMTTEFRQIAQVLGKPFTDKVMAALNIDETGLKKALAKGRLTTSVLNPILEGFFKEYEGKAAKFSETLPGLVESIGDVKKNILGDFFGPILDGAIPAMAFFVDTFTNASSRNAIKNFGKQLGNDLKNGVLVGGRAIAEVLIRLGLVAKENPLFDRFFENGAVPPEAIAGITAFADKVSGFITFLRNNAEIIKGVISGIGAAFGVLAGFGQIINIVSKVGPMLIGLSSPIGVLSVLIGGAVAAWTTNFMGFRDMVGTVWQKIQGPLGQLSRAIQSVGLSLSYGVNFKDAFTNAMFGLIKPEIISQFDPLLGIPDKIKLAWEGKIGVGTLFGDIVLGVTNTMTNILTAINNSKTNVVQAGTDVVNSLLDGFNKVTVPEIQASLESGFLVQLGSAAGGLVAQVATALDTWVQVFNGITGRTSAEDMAPGIKTMVDNLKTAITNADSIIQEAGAQFMQGFKDGAGASVDKFFEDLLGKKTVDTLLDIQKTIALLSDPKTWTQDATSGPGAQPWRGDLFTRKERYAEWLKNNRDLGDMNLAPEAIVQPVEVTFEVMEMMSKDALDVGWAKANNIVMQGGRWYTNGGKPNQTYIPIEIWLQAVQGRGQKFNAIQGTATQFPSLWDATGLPAGMKPVQTSANTFTVPTQTLAVETVVTPTVTVAPTIGPAAPAGFGGGSSGGSATAPAAAINNWAAGSGLTPATGSAAPSTSGTLVYNSSQPIVINAPVQINPVADSTAPKTGAAGPATNPNASFVDAWAKAQGFTQDGTSWKIPTPIALTIPYTMTASQLVPGTTGGSTGSSTAPGVNPVSGLVEQWARSQGWVLENSKWRVNTPITLTLPVIIDASVQQQGGAAGGVGGGAATTSLLGAGVIDSIAASFKDNANLFKITVALTNAVKGAINLSTIDLGLNPVSAESPAGQIGKKIGDSIGVGLGDSMTVINDKLDLLSTKLETMRLNQIEPTAASITSLASTTLVGFVGPKFLEFRDNYLIPLNSELSRMNTLIGSIITGLGNLGTAALNASKVSVPNVGGGSAPPPGGTIAGANAPNNVDVGKNRDQTISFTVPVHVGDEKVSEKVFTFTKGKLVEEMNRF